ncbi:MAG: DUF642 domain-containing protein [Sedimentisphaerales bacterium]|nr:DUF642 domain-containing protein [Sedimentisphaerales bacterium]
MKKLILFGLILGLCAGQSFASFYFSDNFDSENSGNAMLDYDDFTNWGVSEGSVDLIGNGPPSTTFPFDFIPGHGLYVDMDGTINPKNAGTITHTFNLVENGTYQLSFYLAGNHRNNDYEQVDVKVGGPLGDLLINKSYSSTGNGLGQNVGFTLFTETFNLAGEGSYFLSFSGFGGDNIGLLLDDVTLVLVPLPATILLGLLGLGVGGLKLRKSLK